jgi:thiol-disulfide isomerase/thioredoxin
MALTAAYLKEKFSIALTYEAYLQSGTDEQQRRWTQVYNAAHLGADPTRLVEGFTRSMHVLIDSGIWCGDCVQQIPLLQRIAEGNPRQIQLRILDRDQHRDLTDQLHINGGQRVPVVLFMAEDFELCSVAGDRTLHRYRAMARRQLGASCPVAIAGPDPDELASTLGDWLDEFERVQLMLRLSTRLRQLHGD